MTAAATIPRPLRVLAALGVLVFVPAWRLVPAGLARGEAAAEPAAAKPSAASSQIAGAGSCSARACHGSVSPAAAEILRNEYTTWLTADDHSEAYTTLVRDPLSQSIAAKLGKPTGSVIPAYEDTRCLACHAAPGAQARSAQVAEGVSCESCHGASGNWLAAHTTESWRKLTPAQKHARGMLEARDPATRARTCTGCHVGGPADASRGLAVRDVNHDLIAAGHPRMTFELTAYLDAMPHHWAETERETSLTARARLWAAGQIEVATASLRLLEDRASHTERPWPELAELDCFACHHDLRAQGSPFVQPGGVRSPGAPVWNDWPFAALPEALALASDGKAERASDFARLLQPLRTLQKDMSRMVPGRAQTGQLAKEVTGRLEPWSALVGHAECTPADVASVLGILVDDRSANDRRWLSRTQDYLAARALYPALIKQDTALRSEQVEAFLEQNAAALAFPKGYDSPRAGGGR